MMDSYTVTLLSRAPGVQPRCSRVIAGLIGELKKAYWCSMAFLVMS
jgi:hypothetical protein